MISFLFLANGLVGYANNNNPPIYWKTLPVSSQWVKLDPSMDNNGFKGKYGIFKTKAGAEDFAKQNGNPHGPIELDVLDVEFDNKTSSFYVKVKDNVKIDTVRQSTIYLVIRHDSSGKKPVYIYTINLLSSKLSNLTINPGSLIPDFEPGTMNYTGNVPNDTMTVKVTPTAEDPTASITVNGIPVKSGEPSGPITLRVGTNTIPVVVTAKDGTTKRYTITIERTSAKLSGLVLTPGKLEPAFSTGTLDYTGIVPLNTNTVTVTPTAEDPTATIKVNGISVESGEASGPITLQVGTNTIPVVVTTTDGISKTYTISIYRASSNTGLNNLILNEGTLSPIFSTGTMHYKGNVAEDVTAVTVTPTVADPKATITVNGNLVDSGQASRPISLQGGTNIISVVVTAEDKTSKTYTIEIDKPIDNQIVVTHVTLNKEELTLILRRNGEQLFATVHPDDATNKEVRWSSSNPAVATVDNSGYVTPIGVGTTTITVTTVAGGETATCIVEVLPPTPEFNLIKDTVHIIGTQIIGTQLLVKIDANNDTIMENTNWYKKWYIGKTDNNGELGQHFYTGELPNGTGTVGIKLENLTEQQIDRIKKEGITIKVNAVTPKVDPVQREIVIPSEALTSKESETKIQIKVSKTQALGSSGNRAARIEMSYQVSLPRTGIKTPIFLDVDEEPVKNAEGKITMYKPGSPKYTIKTGSNSHSSIIGNLKEDGINKESTSVVKYIKSSSGKSFKLNIEAKVRLLVVTDLGETIDLKLMGTESVDVLSREQLK